MAPDVIELITLNFVLTLNTRPNFNLPTLLGLIHDQRSYEEFRDELTRSPIAHEDDALFLAGLKERMDVIESMRNCVAHNRRPSRSTSQITIRAEQSQKIQANLAAPRKRQALGEKVLNSHIIEKLAQRQTLCIRARGGLGPGHVVQCPQVGK